LSPVVRLVSCHTKTLSNAELITASTYGSGTKGTETSDFSRSLKVKKELREWFRQFKSTLQCAICGEDHPACLDFHHNDPSQKELSLGHLPGLGWSKERILGEVAKCVVLYANCHRKLHYNERTSSL